MKVLSQLYAKKLVYLNHNVTDLKTVFSCVGNFWNKKSCWDNTGTTIPPGSKRKKIEKDSRKVCELVEGF